MKWQILPPSRSALLPAGSLAEGGAHVDYCDPFFPEARRTRRLNVRTTGEDVRQARQILNVSQPQFARLMVVSSGTASPSILCATLVLHGIRTAQEKACDL